MEPFLVRLAHAILAEHGTALREVAVVLPSERAGLHLRHALARAAGAPLWSPELLTLATCTQRISGHRPLPMEELLFEAYEAYREVSAGEAQPLTEFLQWAPTALNDMSEADAHLVPLDGFYRDLRSWEELEWSFNEDPLSPGQQRMVRYWAMKGRLHAALNTRLQARSLGTNGLVERIAAEQDTALPWRTLWFAGLNALTPAQERILDRARRQGIARFAWDADTYYLTDHAQEAGLHLRKAIGRFGPGMIPPVDGIRSGQLKVETVGTPNEAAQAWCAARLLVEAAPDERRATAVVLANGNLLGPVLEALPTDLGAINVTMGSPVSNLPAGALLEALLELHAGARPDKGYFHRDVERLLRHPFLQQGSTAHATRELLADVARSQRTFVPVARLGTFADALPEPFGQHARQVFTSVTNAAHDLPERTNALLSWARLLVQHDAFSTEQLYQASLALQRFQPLLATYHPDLDPSAYGRIHQRLLRTAEVGLFGEPLQGVQVMGLLETRALDHRRIVVLGAQEGDLPSGGNDRSFIPFELRRAYAMPLRDSTDAVQAYNFMRMLHGAELLVLVHPEGDASKGRSRYILQLEHELAHRVPVSFTARQARIPVPVRATASVLVAKDEAVLARLRALLQKGLTPSQLGEWLTCPLDFHLRRVLGVKETDEVAARIAANVLGEGLHTTVENLYRPWLGSSLRADDLREAATRVPAALRTTLASVVAPEVMEAGQPLLQLEMAAQAAQRFLRKEAELVEGGADIVPSALELDLNGEVPRASAALGTPVHLRGRLDRVDVRDGRVHILDLKTGRVNDAELTVHEPTLAAFNGGKRYAAQLLTYAWLYLNKHPEVEAVRAGLLPLQRPSASGGVYLRVDGSDRIGREMMPAIEAFFQDVARTMLDPGIPVQHDPKSRFCRFCVA
ncbi:MAG TPA: PD-(D/E)XK nuclease family protein [Flavobacteriales bacterium]